MAEPRKIASAGDIVHDDDGIPAYRVCGDIWSYEMVSSKQFKGLNGYADPVAHEIIPEWLARRVDVVRHGGRLLLDPGRAPRYAGDA